MPRPVKAKARPAKSSDRCFKRITKKAVKKTRTVKAKARKSAIDKINATVAKWDLDVGCPDHIKLGTSDFLDLLASKLEKGECVNHSSAVGTLSVFPKKPKELLNTVKYLRKQSTIGTKKV